MNTSPPRNGDSSEPVRAAAERRAQLGSHRTALALFSLLLTRFLGPVDDAADARGRALMVALIVGFVVTAVASYVALALLPRTREAADPHRRSAAFDVR